MDSLYKEIIRHEVMPAMGCTEQGCLALACALAARQTGSKISLNDRIKITLNPGMFKNICGLKVVGTNLKGIEAAAALGAICGNPELELQALQTIEPTNIDLAEQVLANHRITIGWNPDWHDLRVEVVVKKRNGYGYALIENSHTNVVCQGFAKEYPEFPAPKSTAIIEDYTAELKTKTLAQLIEMAKQIDAADREWIWQGIKMNMKLADTGQTLNLVGAKISVLASKGILPNGWISKAKATIAGAVDARMYGWPLDAMASATSGNQGNLAILGPFLAGVEWAIGQKRIEQAIALSHLINSFLHCHIGKLSFMCGCAFAAGAGAAAAIAYLRTDDVDKIYKAIINFIGGNIGITCDGANDGCAMVVANATGAAIEAALLALEDFSIDLNNGLRDSDFGTLAENLGKLGTIGMRNCDRTILEILAAKT